MILSFENLNSLLKRGDLVILEIDGRVTLVSLALDDVMDVFVFLLKNHLKVVAVIHQLLVLLIRNIAIVLIVYQKVIVLFLHSCIFDLESLQFLDI